MSSRLFSSTERGLDSISGENSFIRLGFKPVKEIISFGFFFISLRLFNVYGTRSRTSGTYGAMFGVFLAQKLKNKPFTVVGNGKQTRDFTYVTDVADAFIAAMESDIFYDIFNW